MWRIFVETLHDMEQHFLSFKWSVSRGRDTYGYNICSLWVDGTKVEGCNGGGYDMMGTCLGNWMEKKFQQELKTLDINQFYGLREHDGVRYLDGACGFSSMERVANALGYKLIRNRNNGNKVQHYILQKEV